MNLALSLTVRWVPPATGNGYYHISTQDAYGILYKRISKKLSDKKQSKCQCCCLSGTVCLPLCPLLWFCAIKPLDKEIEELEQMKVPKRLPPLSDIPFTPGLPL